MNAECPLCGVELTARGGCPQCDAREAETCEDCGARLRAFDECRELEWCQRCWSFSQCDQWDDDEDDDWDCDDEDCSEDDDDDDGE